MIEFTRVSRMTETLIRNNSIVLFEILKTEVKTQNFDRVNNLIELLNKCGKRARGKIILSFAYDDDPRELFEIPEVIAYVKAIFSKCPHLAYFLRPNEIAIKGFVLCLSDAKIVSKSNGVASVGVDGDMFMQNMDAVELAVINYGKRINDTEGAKTILAKFGF